MCICDQRAKIDGRKLACPDSRRQLITLMSTSEDAQDQETVQEKLLIENEDLSLPTENIDSIIETETNIFEIGRAHV